MYTVHTFFRRCLQKNWSPQKDFDSREFLARIALMYDVIQDGAARFELHTIFQYMGQSLNIPKKRIRLFCCILVRSVLSATILSHFLCDFFILKFAKWAGKRRLSALIDKKRKPSFNYSAPACGKRYFFTLFWFAIHLW